MDGIESRGKLVVIGASNRQNAIDPALRRPGRFDREIEIGIPDQEGRFEILQIHTRGIPLTEDVDLEGLSKITHGFVGADLESLSKEAAMRSIRRILPEINMEQSKIPLEVLNKIKITNDDFQNALKDVFDRILEIPIPSKEARKQILEIHLEKKPIDSTVNIEKLVEIKDSYTGADIAAMVNAAAMSAIKEHISAAGKNEIQDEKVKQNNNGTSRGWFEKGVEEE